MRNTPKLSSRIAIQGPEVDNALSGLLDLMICEKKLLSPFNSFAKSSLVSMLRTPSKFRVRETTDECNDTIHGEKKPCRKNRGMRLEYTANANPENNKRDAKANE
jgi:hypothetical protein